MLPERVKKIASFALPVWVIFVKTIVFILSILKIFEVSTRVRDKFRNGHNWNGGHNLEWFIRKNTYFGATKIDELKNLNVIFGKKLCNVLIFWLEFILLIFLADFQPKLEPKCPYFEQNWPRSFRIMSTIPLICPFRNLSLTLCNKSNSSPCFFRILTS